MYLRKYEEEYIRSIAEKMMQYKNWKTNGEMILAIMNRIKVQRQDYNAYMHSYLKKRAFKGGKKK